MRNADTDIGMLVLYANGMWKQAGIWQRVKAVLFGRHDVFVHLGKRFRITWFKDVPYLASVTEVA